MILRIYYYSSTNRIKYITVTLLIYVHNIYRNTDIQNVLNV